ncbi:diguanylate cyclase domain-containing protein [Halomonas llamarensis]|uniref:Diguanylate cyclase n=1 Tax=Halomonas llamarensis TaxID=2945104 RepID=A0ABT0SQG3_9GAMM|nr:diguanylate cyclase [Halomonas llamarensis]MCL7930055.1 diguanylate cyclase [Halomonas llamarensis]
MIERIPRHLMTLAYSASLVLIASYTTWLYAIGSYADLVIPSFITILLSTALLMHIGKGFKPYVPRLILLASTYIVVIESLSQHAETSLLWLGLPLTAAFILLPLWVALGLNAVLTPLVWWLTPLHHAASNELWVGLCVVILLLALPRWEHGRRQALLRATDPNDDDCNAFHKDTLHARLHSEYQRARVLNRRLAVLVVHLPQLDMAGEQFGHRAQLALLESLCHEVNRHCRDHDILGRADSASFWLVLPDTSESGALLVRERLQRAISRCVLVETGQVEARIAACLPRAQEAFEHFAQRLEARGASLSNA